MRNAALSAVVAVIVALAVAYSVWFLTPPTGACYSDAAFPVWMLEAQNYDGSGIACELPLWQAPPRADWRLYCTGLCQEPDPSDVGFPQQDDDS